MNVRMFALIACVLAMAAVAAVVFYGYLPTDAIFTQPGDDPVPVPEVE